jgi:hypothetical protein
MDRDNLLSVIQDARALLRACERFDVTASDGYIINSDDAIHRLDEVEFLIEDDRPVSDEARSFGPNSAEARAAADEMMQAAGQVFGPAGGARPDLSAAIVKLRQVDSDLAVYLTDNTEDFFEELPEIDEARATVQDVIELLEGERA